LLKRASTLSRQAKFIIAIMLMSCIDAIFTLVWLDLKIGEEANPLLDYVLTFGYVPFVVFKMSLTALGCIVLYKQRNHSLASKAVLGLLAMYTGLMIYHILGAFMAVSN